MRYLATWLFGIFLVVILVIGVPGMIAWPQPDGAPHEQRAWARELHQDWLDSSVVRASTAAQQTIDRASLECTRDRMNHRLEGKWDQLRHPISVTDRYITYHVGCPELVDPYEDWLDSTDSWPK